MGHRSLRSTWSCSCGRNQHCICLDSGTWNVRCAQHGVRRRRFGCFNKSRRTEVTFSSYRFLIRNPDSSPVIVTRLQPREESWLPSPEHSHRLWCATNLLQCVLRALSLGVKRPEREADHSPPSSAGVKSVGQGGEEKLLSLRCKVEVQPTYVYCHLLTRTTLTFTALVGVSYLRTVAVTTTN
jgi:hypothetical protein